MKDYKQVIVLRKDLNMRKGKMVSQGAHSSMGAVLSKGYINDKNELIIQLDEALASWLKGKFKKIVVSVNSEEELLSLRDRAKELGLTHCLIQDSGLTEFGGIPTYTSLSIGPDLSDKIDEITGNLPLL